MATKKEMSLHRIIAEIKAIEGRLYSIGGVSYAFTVPVDAASDVAEAKSLSQSNFDKVASDLANLATLKAERNKANAVTQVTIGGNTMTIDQALAKKAANVFQLTFLNTLRAQMNTAKARVDQTQAQIEAKIAQQVQAASSGTKKATEDEIKVFRQLAERNTKLDIVTMDGLKERIDQMAAELEQFATEVDYTLSEVNAITKVTVELV